MADRRVTAPLGAFGGKFRAGRPWCIVIHSLEAPARKGMAWSLATGWMQNLKPKPKSVHAIAGPDEVIDMVDLDTVAYHCGGGNAYSLGLELTGYAAWTREQWLSGDSKRGSQSGSFDALRHGARKTAEWCKRYDIPIRWLEPAEVAKGARGLITHDIARRAWGGTTHTDPGPQFPFEIFLRMVQDFAGMPRQPDPTTQAPGQQIGGAEPEEEEMARIFYVRHEDGKIWATTQLGGQLHHVPTEKALRDALWAQQNYRLANGEPAVEALLLSGNKWVPFTHFEQLEGADKHTTLDQFGYIAPAPAIVTGGTE